MAIFSREDFEQAFEVTPVRYSVYRSVFKRAFDILFVLIIAAPVTLVVLLLACSFHLMARHRFTVRNVSAKTASAFPC